MVVITGIKRAISLLINVENVSVWMPQDKSPIGSSVPRHQPRVVGSVFWFLGDFQNSGFWGLVQQLATLPKDAFAELEGTFPGSWGGCLRGPVLQPRVATLGAGSSGTLQRQPHGWSSSPKPFGLIFSHQLTQSQKRPANASSLLVHLCAPRCCPASAHRSRLPGALVPRHTALSLQALKGSEPLLRHPWRPRHSTRRDEEAKAFLLSLLFSRLRASPWASEPWHCLSTGLGSMGLGPSARTLAPPIAL